MKSEDYKKLISEAFDAYTYAQKQKEKGGDPNFDPRNPKTWAKHTWYKNRMKKLAGLIKT